MQKSLLNVEDYFFTLVEIKANPDFDAESDNTAINIKTDFKFRQGKADSSNWQVVLTITLSGNGEQEVPYEGVMEAVGLFKFPNGSKALDEKKVLQIIGANGPAILYTAARELFLTVAGRGPWEPPCWPAVNFVDTKLEKVEANKPRKGRKPSGKKKKAA